MPAESKLSVHRVEHQPCYFVAYGYAEAGSASPETCRVSPYYTSLLDVREAYDEKRAEYGELDA